MAYVDIEDSRMYQRAEKLADQVWRIVIAWQPFAKDTVGKQLVRAVDSVGANIAEGGGRYHVGDVIRFCYFSRGSLRETRYWLKRALTRQLIVPDQFNNLMTELVALGKELNAYIRSQRSRKLAKSGNDNEIASDDETN